MLVSHVELLLGLLLLKILVLGELMADLLCVILPRHTLPLHLNHMHWVEALCGNLLLHMMTLRDVLHWILSLLLKHLCGWVNDGSTTSLLGVVVLSLVGVGLSGHTHLVCWLLEVSTLYRLILLECHVHGRRRFSMILLDLSCKIAHESASLQPSGIVSIGHRLVMHGLLCHLSAELHQVDLLNVLVLRAVKRKVLCEALVIWILNDIAVLDSVDVICTGLLFEILVNVSGLTDQREMRGTPLGRLPYHPLVMRLNDHRHKQLPVVDCLPIVFVDSPAHSF